MGTILVTGGAGFIGSNLVLDWIATTRDCVVNLDKLTYAGHLASLASLRGNSRHIFVHGDIADRELVSHLLRQHRPLAVVNLAAETHVDRSIHTPDLFVATNIHGTFHLLEVVRGYYATLPEAQQKQFRFLHVSTDEVYGSLGPHDSPFSEAAPYAPNSPYAASKAAADHLVRAYFHTYGLPTIVTNCSNNYGPRQFPEKLIPLMILNAISGGALPVYGDGLHIRDWLHVGDHCTAIRLVLAEGRVGETYNIGGRCEKTNLDVVRMICKVLDELIPASSATPRLSLLTFIVDRPGHDRRYAIDDSKLRRELGWQVQHDFESGIRNTIKWYIEHRDWVGQVTDSEYRKWIVKNYVCRTVL